jgi:hypothetical protein
MSTKAVEMVKERKREKGPRDFSGEKGFEGKKALENV